MDNNQKIKGIIFDIDGTLILNGQPFSGAIETISLLRKADILLRFITNTTVKTAEQLGSSLRAWGFDIQDNEIMTSVTACLQFIDKNYPDKAGLLAIPETLAPQFTKIKQTKNNPTFVVLGDLDEAFDYAILNQVFNYIRDDAQLITFHRNLYFFREQKTWLDSGAFTFALEQATGQKALVMGKPAPAMFEIAIASMQLNKNEVIVVGDDVLTDIQGAENAGLTGYLVATGKFKPEQLNEYHISPENHLRNIKDILNILGIDK
ncbi:hypothetical protein AYL20_12025 [Acinetobacter venetianus]|uniref:HAD-IIA family hydrolase n=1 Tax=Acinetobacter venetianus TaxID=52133 RepID=UPI0007759376|nr:HAD-IIA family hydrolase [Acinetobacter venetianus]KXO74164.1 hypothetical protein AYL20_12025 [Acinetobacter venetianus]